MSIDTTRSERNIDKFNSQICTTKIQSIHLLSLGLKLETADMMYQNYTGHCIGYGYDEYPKCITDLNPLRDVDVPAWSLGRLIEMMPSFIDIVEHSYMFSIIQGKLFSYGSDIVGNAFLYGKGSVYESAIYTIEWLIKEGYFNKEYLN
jgi:hypothetical protein